MSKSKVFTVCLLAAVVLIFGACSSIHFKPTVVKAMVPTPTPAAFTAAVTIAAVGDIMLGSTSINDSFLPPNDGRDILKDVTPELSAADIAFGNLEGPMLEGGRTAKCAELNKPVAASVEVPSPTPTPTPAKPGTPPKPIRCFAFRVPTRYGQYLKDAGFDVMSLPIIIRSISATMDERALAKSWTSWALNTRGVTRTNSRQQFSK